MEQTTTKKAKAAAAAGAVISSLQTRFLAGDPTARAEIARLRAGAGRDPLNSPTVVGSACRYLPEECRSNGEHLTDYEKAVTAAVCLWALHMQGQHTPAHVTGTSIGTAVRIAARNDGSGLETSTLRRPWDLAMSSTSMATTATYLRQVVARIKKQGVGFDYAGLAKDLSGWRWRESRAKSVMRLTRDAYASYPEKTTADTEPTTDNN